MLRRRGTNSPTAESREPDRREIRKAIKKWPFYQCVSSLYRTSKEKIWDSSGQCVDRQIGGLSKRDRIYRGRRKQHGELHLDPSLPIPRYMNMSVVDIHYKLGGYRILKK